MYDLQQLGLVDAIKERVSEQSVPLLGICLGMQLLCSRSEEGDANGLGLIDADVKRFALSPCTRLKIPHMGWSTVRVLRDNVVLPSDQPDLRFYFVHSYYVAPRDSTITTATTHFGHDFCAAFEHNNIIGVQFHPEKSHRFGLALMKRFVEL
jgi:glutamine amidotransferase